jgi:hypothetical protein
MLCYHKTNNVRRDEMKDAPILDAKFIYQSGADCQKVWRRYGWIPPTEYRTDYEFSKTHNKDQQVRGEKWMKI